MSEELNKALEISIDGLPTDEQLKTAALAWRKSLDSPYRLAANKDFLAGSIWGVNLLKPLQKENEEMKNLLSIIAQVAADGDLSTDVDLIDRVIEYKKQ